MQAPVAEQRALLRLQAHDSAIDRLRHRRGSLPEDARLAELADALAAVDQLTAEREGTLATVQRDQSRLEHEIDMVTTKARNEEARAVSSERGRRSACLTFQRPFCWLTTSSESARTRTRRAPSSLARRSPAITPRYSATLLVAQPIPSATSARTSPAGVATTAPYPAGPGLPLAPPSVHTTTSVWVIRSPGSGGSSRSA